MDLLPHGKATCDHAPLSDRADHGSALNSPLLLAAHKLPGHCCGATMVLKPPPDPLSTLALARIVAGAGYPGGALSVVPCSNDDASPLIDDPRVRMISFTGSARVGWMIRSRAPHAHVSLELGGNAAVVVEPDADLDHAVRRCVFGAFSFAGQSCISTQRILVHESIYDAFVSRFVPAVGALRIGDPWRGGRPRTMMTGECGARRGWIREAVTAGAVVATGGIRDGAAVTRLCSSTRPAMRVNCERSLPRS